MSDEIKHQIEMSEAKLKTLEVGSVGYNMYKEIVAELRQKLAPKSVKLHVDGGATCEGCQ